MRRAEERAAVSAVVSSCLGGGMMLGQLLVGYFLSQLGWRTPFLLLGLLSLLAAVFLAAALGDPQKGGKEEVSTTNPSHPIPSISPLS